jgi:release factor glutamine methyltransferase
MTNLKQLKKEFTEDLQPTYESSEISTFFTWLTEDLLDLKTHDLLLKTDVYFTEDQLSKFKEAKERLKKEEPIQHILGYAEFFGLKLKVNSNVLIPRPETEELVQWILDDYKSKDFQLSIIDLGTGSGCIPIALAKHLPQSKIKALDVSEKALKLAVSNSEENHTHIEFIHADLLNLETLPEVDIIVSNPPYVKSAEKSSIRKNVVDHEPHVALFVEDDDPLIFYKKIAELALKSDKRPIVYTEVSQYLAKETQDLFLNLGFKNVELRKDFRGNDRMLKAY